MSRFDEPDIDRIVGNFTSEQIANNRLRLKASIDVVRHLALQAISFRGQDESSTSTNWRNFLTTLDLMEGYNNNVVEIMAKAPKKCLIHITSDSKRNSTCYFNQSEEALTLKNEIYYLFSNHYLDIQNIRGQGYDGASNMQVSNLIKLFSPTCEVLLKIMDEGNSSQKVGAKSAYEELNHRFSEHVMELLTLSSALDPREHSGFKNLKNISELCQWMVRTRKSEYYPLIYKVVKLVLTLPVSTATTERTFSAMYVIKTDLRNKMEDEFLSDAMMLFIERDIAATISTDSFINDFEDLKRQRVPFS
ncbi:uncharacterized protein LOC142639594 [Castanea sativa]|uniref:uncharacterized protein LOC142639594 n=1 Tax=Castanea sativa TaxID=21020 RepID=UPI003F651F35